MIKRFEDLEVWCLAREFAKLIYAITKSDLFSKEFVQFLFIAKGSCGETRSQLYRAFDIGYINNEVFVDCLGKAERISRSLSGLIKYLKQSDYRGTKYK